MKQIVLSSCLALMAITGFAQAKTTTSATQSRKQNRRSHAEYQIR